MKPGALSVKLILLTWLTLFSLSLSAQKKGRPLIDSILRKLPAAREDTNKVNLWVKLSNGYSDIKAPDSAEFYIQHALTLTRQLKWPKGYYYIGHHYGWHAKQLDKARFYLHDAAEEGLKAGNYPLVYSAANVYALTMVRLNKNPESISYLASLAKRMQTNNARAQLAGIYALMGDFVQESYNYSATIAYYNKALGIEETDHRKYLTNDHILGIAYFNMRLHNFDRARSVLRKELKTISPADLNSQGAFAMAFAESYIQANDYKNGISNYEKVITIARTEKYPSLESGAENAIGWSYFEMKQYDKAYSYTVRSLALVKGDTADMVYPLSTLASLYREAPDYIIKKAGLKPGTQYDESLRLLTICLNYAKDRPEWEQFVYTCYQELSKTYAKMHRYADAFKAYQTYTTKKDSLDSLSNEKSVLLKQAQLDYSRKEDSLNYQQTLTNTQLKQKKTESYFFVGGIAGLLLLSVFIWLNFNNQRKSNRLLTDANHQLNEQREEITVQRDQLSDTLTSLKAAQQQLIQSEKMASLGELTAGIAHEIQNPLNFVNNFSDVNREMLEELKTESEKPKAERDEQLVTELIKDLVENEQKINHHGKRADAIVKGMLEHSRASTGLKEPTALNKLADEYLRLAYHGLRAKDKSFNAELVTYFEPNLPLVNTVPQDIGRVLLNLFNNAFYAVQQKQLNAGDNYNATVEVATAVKDQQVQLTVKDNGTGIPDAIKDKIMQPFFTTKPTGQGTGLGLSLSYDIVVKGHGGNIVVNSIQDEGSEFTILLPPSNSDNK